MTIRILLIAAVLWLALLALRTTPSSRGLAVRRVAMILFTFAWVAAVLSPDSLTTIAQAIGVGRGTDLLLYVLVVAVALGAIGIYKRFLQMDQRIVDLTRELAIVTAHRAWKEEPIGDPAALFRRPEPDNSTGDVTPSKW